MSFLACFVYSRERNNISETVLRYYKKPLFKPRHDLTTASILS